MYFNTTKLKGTILSLFEEKAKNQDEDVLRAFRILKTASPSKVYDYIQTKSPLTSIRRSIYNLTKEGRLTKTDKKVIGKYGRPEYVWIFKN